MLILPLEKSKSLKFRFSIIILERNFFPNYKKLNQVLKFDCKIITTLVEERFKDYGNRTGTLKERFKNSKIFLKNAHVMRLDNSMGIVCLFFIAGPHYFDFK